MLFQLWGLAATLWMVVFLLIYLAISHVLLKDSSSAPKVSEEKTSIVNCPIIPSTWHQYNLARYELAGAFIYFGTSCLTMDGMVLNCQPVQCAALPPLEHSPN